MYTEEQRTWIFVGYEIHPSTVSFKHTFVIRYGIKGDKILGIIPVFSLEELKTSTKMAFPYRREKDVQPKIKSTRRILWSNKNWNKVLCSVSVNLVEAQF